MSKFTPLSELESPSEDVVARDSGTSDEFIDSIIAEINNTGEVDKTPIEYDEVSTEPVMEATAATTADTSSNKAVGDTSGDPVSVHTEDTKGADEEEEGTQIKKSKDSMTITDAECWFIIAKGLRGPLVVGIVTALISSPHLYAPLVNKVPLLSAPNMQGLLLRFVIGFLFFLGLRHFLRIE